MKLHSLEIPEESESIADWLELQLMDKSFGEFAVQLQAIHDSLEESHPNLNLNEILGNSLEAVMVSGLSNCADEQVRQLLGNPTALLELHQLIFESGSEHWFNTVRSQATSQTSINEFKSTIETLSKTDVAMDPVGESTARSGATDRSQEQVELPDKRQQETTQSPSSTRRGFNWELMSLAAAALVAATVGWGLYSRTNTQSLAKWGWLADDGLPDSDSPGEYLNQLATGGHAWFDKPLPTVNDYVQRLTEMRAGCDVLINASHPVLAAKDRQWLIEKCEIWKASFDSQLRMVRAEPLEFQKFLQQTNGTVNLLVKALKEKAEAV